MADRVAGSGSYGEDSPQNAKLIPLESLLDELARVRPGVIDGIARLQQRALIVMRLRERREKLELSQAQVAALMRVTPEVVAQIETNVRAPSPDLLQKYAGAVGLDTGTLGIPDPEGGRA